MRIRFPAQSPISIARQLRTLATLTAQVAWCAEHVDQLG